MCSFHFPRRHCRDNVDMGGMDVERCCSNLLRMFLHTCRIFHTRFPNRPCCKYTSNDNGIAHDNLSDIGLLQSRMRSMATARVAMLTPCLYVSLKKLLPCYTRCI